MRENIVVERPLRGASIGGGKLASIQIKWVSDDTPDLEFIGKYTDTEEPSAIECKNRSGNEYKYFVSRNNATYDPKDWEHVSGAEKAKLIAKHGSLANVTRFYAREDMKRMQGYNEGKWHMTGCVVKATYGATEASDSLWGIESDCGENYRKIVERDCIANAIAELRFKMKGAKTA